MTITLLILYYIYSYLKYIDKIQVIRNRYSKSAQNIALLYEVLYLEMK